MRLRVHPRVQSEDSALKLVGSGYATALSCVVCTLVLVTSTQSSSMASTPQSHASVDTPMQTVPQSAGAGVDQGHSGLSCRLTGKYHDKDCRTCSYILNQTSASEVSLSCTGRNERKQLGQSCRHASPASFVCSAPLVSILGFARNL